MQIVTGTLEDGEILYSFYSVFEHQTDDAARPQLAEVVVA